MDPLTKDKSIMEINTSLSPPQARFALWLEERMPEFLPLFNFRERAYNEEVVDRYLSTASHGEVIMARFVLGVWLGKNDFNFDILDAASLLDYRYKTIISAWFSEPFWP